MGVQACSTAAVNSFPAEYDYTITGSSTSGKQSPDLMPLPESDPDTPAKPDGKRLKGELTLLQLQSNTANLINERANNKQTIIKHGQP